MRKTQTLPYETGDSNMMYWSASKVGPYDDEHEKDKFTLSWYHEGRNAANLTMPGSYLGNQTFESSERERPLYNDCSNDKIRGYNYPYGATFRHATRSNTDYWDPYRRFYLYSHFLSYVVNADLSFSWSAAEGARRRAWWNMKPRFEGRVNLLNTLFELKDFRDIAKYAVKIDLVKVGRAFGDLRKALWRARQRLGIDVETTLIGDIPKVLRAIDYTTRGIASLVLTKRLAIDPTVADYFAITEQMRQSAVAQQREFAKRGETPQRSHYTESLDKDVELDVHPSANYYWVKWKKQNELKFTATSEYMYKYKMRSPNQALQRYWGLTLNAPTVWNAMPFTWIADYFVSIGKSLEAMETDPNVTLLPIQYCESLERKAKAVVETCQDSRCYWLCLNGKLSRHASPSKVPIAGYEASSYRRRVVAPSFGPALPKINWPSSRQIGTLAALVRCFI